MKQNPGVRASLNALGDEVSRMCAALAANRHARQALDLTPSAEDELDRQLDITIFKDPYAFTKEEVRLSLKQLTELIQMSSASSKGQLKLLKLGSFGNRRNANNCLRTNDNFLSIDGVEADYDAGEISVTSAVAILRKANIFACVYETASSMPEAPRFRILCPLSMTMSVRERAGQVARLQGLFRGNLAAESFIPSQAFFFGAVEGQHVPEVHLVPGRYLDQAEELDTGALGADGCPFLDPRNNSPLPEGSHELGEPIELDRIDSALEAFPAERWKDRDFWLRLMMSVKRAVHGSEEGYDLFARYSELGGEKYDAENQRETWDSIDLTHPDGIGPGTLFYEASKHPRPTSWPVSDGLEVLSVADCLAAPPRDYIIKGFLQVGYLSSIFGAPGAGKSTLCPYLAYHVAKGEEVFGLRVKQGLVFYVVAEDEEGLPQRIAALASRHGTTDQFRVIRRVRSLRDEAGSNYSELLSLVQEHRPALVVIDTLAAAFPGLAENESKDMSLVISVGKAMTNLGAAVLILHHDTKQKSDTPRGHSSFNGILDSALHLKRGEDGVVSGELTKNRAGPLGIDFSFKIQTHLLGKDPDGEDLTAPVVEEVAGRQKNTEKRLTAAQYHARKILDDLTADSPEGVCREVWRDRCITSGLVSSANDRAGQRRGVNTAITELLRHNHVCVTKEELYISEIRSISGIFDDEPEVTSAPENKE